MLLLKKDCNLKNLKYVKKASLLNFDQHFCVVVVINMHNIHDIRFKLWQQWCVSNFFLSQPVYFSLAVTTSSFSVSTSKTVSSKSIDSKFNWHVWHAYYQKKKKWFRLMMMIILINIIINIGCYKLSNGYQLISFKYVLKFWRL